MHTWVVASRISCSSLACASSVASFSPPLPVTPFPTSTKPFAPSSFCELGRKINQFLTFCNYDFVQNVAAEIRAFASSAPSKLLASSSMQTDLRPPPPKEAAWSFGASCRRSKWLGPSRLWRLPLWLPTLKVRFMWLPYDEIDSL